MSNNDTQREMYTYAFQAWNARDLQEAVTNGGMRPVEVSGDAITVNRAGGLSALVARINRRELANS